MIAGTGEMSTAAKLSGFSAAFFLAAFVTACGFHGAAIDAYLHVSHLQATDWVLLIFGSLFVAGLTYSFITQPDICDWRGGFWFVIGAFMICAALGDNPASKEAACRIINSRQHVWTSSCYQ
jgi:hypothetical protein